MRWCVSVVDEIRRIWQRLLVLELLLGQELLFSETLLARLLLQDLVITDWGQEGLQMLIKIIWADPQVPVQEEEHLLLHEVDLCDGKAEVREATDGCVSCPVLVLWRRVVEILCGEDERGKEDTMHSAAHSFGHGR
jgi:hypothetical protein